MAIAFQTASTQALEGGTGGGSVTKPSGTVDGDFLIFGLYYEQGASPSNPTVSGTWTSIASVNGNPTFDGVCSVWYRRASSEPASYTITTNGTYGSGTAAFILRYTGVLSTGTPIRTSATTAPSNSGSPQSGPNLTGLSASDLVIQVAGVNHNTWAGANITISGPGGSWTQRANIVDDASTASNPGIAAIEQFNQGTGPSWSATSTATDFGFARIGFALIEEPASSFLPEPSINTQQAVRRSYYF